MKNTTLTVSQSISLEKPALKFSLRVLGGIAILSLLAQIKFYLPFSSVPFTGQTLGVLIISMVYRPKEAFCATLGYLLAGCAGLPVFSNAVSSFAALGGHTAGYLWGMVISATLISYFAHKKEILSKFETFFLLGLGHLLILACGFVVLQSWIGMDAAFVQGVLPFLLTTVLKIFLAMSAISVFKKAGF